LAVSLADTKIAARLIPLERQKAVRWRISSVSDGDRRKSRGRLTSWKGVDSPVNSVSTPW